MPEEAASLKREDTLGQPVAAEAPRWIPLVVLTAVEPPFLQGSPTHSRT
jgi:hypothetical protein